MSTDEAKQNVGKLVMSYDAGFKGIERVRTPHGPYRIERVLKGGLVMLEGYEPRVRSSLLFLCDP